MELGSGRPAVRLCGITGSFGSTIPLDWTPGAGALGNWITWGAETTVCCPAAGDRVAALAGTYEGVGVGGAYVGGAKYVFGGATVWVVSMGIVAIGLVGMGLTLLVLGPTSDTRLSQSGAANRAGAFG